MTTITAKDGAEINFRDRGKGPVVTFSHGITATHQDRVNADLLAFITA